MKVALEFQNEMEKDIARATQSDYSSDHTSSSNESDSKDKS